MSFEEKESNLSLDEVPYEEKESNLSLDEVPYEEKESNLSLDEVPYEEKENNLSLDEVSYEEKESNLSFDEVSYEEKESNLSFDEISYEEKESNLSLDELTFDDEESISNYNESNEKENNFILDEMNYDEQESNFNLDESNYEEKDSNWGQDGDSFEENEPTMSLEEMIQETLQREGLISPEEKFSLENVEKSEEISNLILPSEPEGKIEYETDLEDSELELPTNKTIQENEPKEEIEDSINNKLFFVENEEVSTDDTSNNKDFLDFENADFEFNFDTEETVEDNNENISDELSIKADDEEYNDNEYNSHFNDYFDVNKEEKNSEQDLIDKVLKDIQAADEGTNFEEMSINKAKESSAFEKKQTEFLTGKIVNKDIRSEHGEVIAKAGELINDRMIQKVKKQGKLIELIMNCN